MQEAAYLLSQYIFCQVCTTAAYRLWHQTHCHIFAQLGTHKVKWWPSCCSAFNVSKSSRNKNNRRDTHDTLSVFSDILVICIGNHRIWCTCCARCVTSNVDMWASWYVSMKTLEHVTSTWKRVQMSEMSIDVKHMKLALLNSGFSTSNTFI